MEIEFISIEDDCVCARVDVGIYSRTALLKVAHRFTDRCHVHLQDEGETRVAVRFSLKDEGADCSALAGEFMNAVLDQTLREQVASETEPVRNLILAHALSNTALIHPELETIDPSDDPLGAGTPDSKKYASPQQTT